jgi:hypothetical protein
VDRAAYEAALKHISDDFELGEFGHQSIKTTFNTKGMKESKAWSVRTHLAAILGDAGR